jgi:FtsP/CotA-like multicopper oxidase with cupredoxin domain
MRAFDVNGRHGLRLSRREMLLGGAAAALTANFADAQSPADNIDYTIRIAPVALEIAPGKTIETTGYNGQIPGPVLRLREATPVNIKVTNGSGYDNLVHWHGLYLPAQQDGATEEGSPIIPVGQSLIYSFMPKPTGTRWYHSHATAMTNLNRSTYSGEFGFVIVEPAGDPGRYDREILLAARHWEGEWVSLQDIRKGPPPNNGLEVMYRSATLGQRMLGHDEPIRVRQGERVLFRLLNASATMDVSLALPGHKFTVLALDGNPVPNVASVDVLRLDVAERADVIVEMNNPGVWVFGSTDDMDRGMGMGAVIEYENRQSEPQWTAPPTGANWDYTAFARTTAAAQADDTVMLNFEKIPGGRGGYNRWTINGKSWPDTNPLFTVQEGRRYRLVLHNNSGDRHPIHTHRHTFEVTKIGDSSISGLMKDTLSLPRYSTSEVDFIANDPGPTFFHCHHQDHMDEGFAGLISYV